MSDPEAEQLASAFQQAGPPDDEAAAATRAAIASVTAAAAAEIRAAGGTSRSVALPLTDDVERLCSPLRLAAGEGDSDKVARLIAGGADPLYP